MEVKIAGRDIHVEIQATDYKTTFFPAFEVFYYKINTIIMCLKVYDIKIKIRKLYVSGIKSFTVKLNTMFPVGEKYLPAFNRVNHDFPSDPGCIFSFEQVGNKFEIYCICRVGTKVYSGIVELNFSKAYFPSTAVKRLEINY